MRVFFKTGAKRVSLKSEGLTLLHYKKPDLYCVRKYFIPPKTEHNTLMGSIFKNLTAIWKSAPLEFKEQFTLYAEWYNQQYRVGKYPLNNYACFTKIMFEIRKEHPDLNLTTLRYETIINYQLLIINGGEEKKAIEGEWLVADAGREETLFGEISIDIQDKQDGETIINYQLLIINDREKSLVDNLVEEIYLGRVVGGTMCVP